MQVKYLKEYLDRLEQIKIKDKQLYNALMNLDIQQLIEMYDRVDHKMLQDELTKIINK